MAAAASAVKSAKSVLRDPAGVSAGLIRYYFDYKSPFSYLSFESTHQLERDFHVTIEYKPYPFAMKDAFGLPGERSPYHQLKVKYAYLDARRFANERGLTLLGPQKAFDSTLAMCGGVYALSQNRTAFYSYTEKVFERFFKRALDIESPSAIAGVLTEAGLSMDEKSLTAFAGGAGQTALASIGAQAKADGVFGVPFYYLVDRKEPFFGSDRVAALRKQLTADGLLRRPTAASGPASKL